MFSTIPRLSMYQFRGRVGVFLAFVLIVALVIVVTGYDDFKHKFISNSVFKDKRNPYIFNGEATLSVPQKHLKGNNGFAQVAPSNSINNDKDIYAIVFDAGSTGSRVHVFKFKTLPGGLLRLDKELFKTTKPGLSAYANDPQMGAESLRPMVIEALAFVPKAKQNVTPITLKATAGLRLLSEGVADNILNEVTQMFKQYPFPLGDVSIMDGIDEGIFSWITLNYILGTLTNGNKTVAALDLGGGSTQITFVPQHRETVKAVPKNFTSKITLFNKSYKLYTHSYLGQGLMSARFSLLSDDKEPNEVTNTTVLSSPCLPNKFAGNFRFGAHRYRVGALTNGSSFNACLKDAVNFVDRYMADVKELSNADIYIFSYFFDRANDAGIIAKDGGQMTIKDFKKAAAHYFSKPLLDHPYLGMDLTYIYALLHDGYHIRPNKGLEVIKKVNGTEISWALGSAFHLLYTMGLAK
ncbi:ectonucleoside triphosphate diphosphohydrolase 5-like isoform X2 [Ostrea edulis]|uniref:ectonucleoside triphosphate diphosphohydrolase 5-like isoform X2 n=1 Tax=Ostrea edulis TaxID=37623 RepID=UPI0024AFF716|nr:ectonucleoside triphosphate diphosphohydrolase 5-like isoform X2 [Ostrea edulis]